MDRDVTRTCAAEDCECKIWVDRFDSVFHVSFMLNFGSGHSSKRRSERHTDPLFCDFRIVCDARIGDRHLCSCECELGEAVHSSRRLGVEKIQGIEFINLAGNLGLDLRRIKPRDASDSVASPSDAIPQTIFSVADRRKSPKTCNNDASTFHSYLRGTTSYVAGCGLQCDE